MLKEAAAIGMLSAVLPSFIVYNADEEGKKVIFNLRFFIVTSYIKLIKL
jgi:uncharacterized protein (DUF1778 family)